ncbi:unnamed protein product [Rotaria socialis]|uniref:Uncharacterized protein n=3 Tax=Rotaria socialis TaxID=392032 RepID=A0A817PMV9_9BILA|nr:unnamed protein product [Rotaria socialis]CAF3298714.1 unnamed protein product [Rotaria socialis]CAF3600894.1 unnamed protein product [Rotaria socialis]CAF3686412.1 unnamed protein product [Rotaria socialis]CAF4185905.1 unnamed protein product [Rotaria socialis]
MSSLLKRQLPNVNIESNEKIRHLNTALITTENNLRHAQQNFELLKQIQQPTSTSLLDTFRNTTTTTNDGLLSTVDSHYDQEQTTIGSRRSTTLSSNHQRSNSNKGVRFNDDVIGRSLHNLNNELQSLSTEHGRLKHEIGKTTSSKQQQQKESLTLNDSDDGDVNDSFFSKQDPLVEEIVQSRIDRRLQEIEREIKRDKDQQQQGDMRVLITELQSQRKLTTPIQNEDDKILQARLLLAESNKQMYETQLQNTRRQLEDSEINKSFLAQQLLQLKDQLTRNDFERDKQREDDLVLSMNRRRKTEQDRLQIEHDYLIQQQMMLSKSSTLNEMVTFKKELEKSERQREQLSDHLEVIVKKSDEKERLFAKSLLELKELTENCDTYERQNAKLQRDLALALEKLEEMTQEAERYAQEALNSQKQFADSEQQREELKMQAQETIKQWKAKVKKLEKDVDRHKFGSTQMLERNEHLIKEMENFRNQNAVQREQIAKLETDLNDANTKHNRIEEHFKRTENDLAQLRTIRSTQDAEIVTFKTVGNELESQLSVYRQRNSQLDKEKQNIQQLLQEEINHRNNVDSKLKQAEHDIEALSVSRSQFQQHIIELENERMDFLQKIKEIEFERESLSIQYQSVSKTFNDEKTKFQTKLASLESDYEEMKRKLETAKIEYTRGMKTIQVDYENKIETLKLQLSDEKARVGIFQRHEIEHKKDIERLQEKAGKYEEEASQTQYTCETISRELKEKTRLIDELESKIIKLTVDTNNEKNDIIKKEKDFQNSLHTVYNDIIYCTECLSNDSDEPFILDSPASSRNDIETWLSKVKARLAWLKQELEIRQQQENKLRHDLNNALLDSDADRKYFAAELAKREVIVDDLTRERLNHKDFERESSDKLKLLQSQLARVEGHSVKEIERSKQLQTIEMQIEYEKRRALTEDEKDRINDRYRQFQTMIDSVKRELHTAKSQLSTKSSQS